MKHIPDRAKAREGDKKDCRYLQKSYYAGSYPALVRSCSSHCMPSDCYSPAKLEAPTLEGYMMDFLLMAEMVDHRATHTWLPPFLLRAWWGSPHDRECADWLAHRQQRLHVELLTQSSYRSSSTLSLMRPFFR